MMIVTKSTALSTRGHDSVVPTFRNSRLVRIVDVRCGRLAISHSFRFRFVVAFVHQSSFGPRHVRWQAHDHPYRQVYEQRATRHLSGGAGRRCRCVCRLSLAGDQGSAQLFVCCVLGFIVVYCRATSQYLSLVLHVVLFRSCMRNILCVRIKYQKKTEALFFVSPIFRIIFFIINSTQTSSQLNGTEKNTVEN